MSAAGFFVALIFFNGHCEYSKQSIPIFSLCLVVGGGRGREKKTAGLEVSAGGGGGGEWRKSEGNLTR